ncbi:hypothetical protein Tco_0236874 [Tanacetum coccineum]
MNKFVLVLFLSSIVNFVSPIMMMGKFVIKNTPFSLTLEEFGNILKIPFTGQVSETEMWRLDHLPNGVPNKGPYKTKLPSPNAIKSHVQIRRQGKVIRFKSQKEIVVDKNEILTNEIKPHMISWIDIIRENVICVRGNKDHASACLCHMLYCVETSIPYNLAFFILKRMEKTRSKPKELLPYGMLLTRLYKFVVSSSLVLASDLYISYDPVMTALAPFYKRKRRTDHGKKRSRESNSNSSSSVVNLSSSSHLSQNSNDEESFFSTFYITLQPLDEPLFENIPTSPSSSHLNSYSLLNLKFYLFKRKVGMSIGKGTKVNWKEAKRIDEREVEAKVILMNNRPYDICTLFILLIAYYLLDFIYESLKFIC